MPVYAKLFAGFLAGLWLAVAVPISAAADTNSPKQPLITVSPPLKQLTLGPGLVEATTNVSVSNDTSNTYNATIKLVDFKTLEQTGGITLGQVGVPLWKYGLANWMSLPGGNHISLAPGQKTNITVNIANRTDLTPGGHYGAVVISSSSSGSGNTNVNLDQNLVSLLFVKKLGGINYGLSLDSISKSGGLGLPTSVNTTFSSTGNVYVIPRGYIEVYDPNGKLVEKGIININSQMILQGSSEKLITLLQPTGQGDTSLGGRYRLTAYYRYDGQNGYNTKTIYFKRSLLSSWQAILVGFVGVIWLVLLFYILHNGRKHLPRE